MQLLFDFLPVIVFFVAYKLTRRHFRRHRRADRGGDRADGVQWIRHRKVSSMVLISGVLVLVFGGLTLLHPRQGLHPVEGHGA